MAIRNILKDSDECLRQKCKAVEGFDSKLHSLLDDMAQTMAHADGCGLAANQIGILRCIFLTDDGNGVREFINPQIYNQSGSQKRVEGCLSIPEKRAEITRPQSLTIKYQDRNAGWHEMNAQGFLAQIICHEYDHLIGKLFTDYIEEAK